jgi:hypothetical protein
MDFKETQQFAPWALWLMRVMALLVIVVFVIIYLEFELSPLYTAILVVAFVVSFLPCLLLEISRLRTEVNKAGVSVNFAPFAKKQFDWSDIKSAEVIDYGFVGGWGVRMGTKYGTIYSTQGKEGLSLGLKSGKKVVVGTQRKAEMQQAIDKFFVR